MIFRFLLITCLLPVVLLGQSPNDYLFTKWDGTKFVQDYRTTFPPDAHNQSWSTITSTPTTLAGYGITDAITSAAVAAGYQPLSANLTSLAAGSLTGNLTVGGVNNITSGGGFWRLEGDVKSGSVRAQYLEIGGGFDGSWNTVGFKGTFNNLALTADRVYNVPNESGTLMVAGSVATRPITMSTARILGRTTAGTGAIEQLTIGSGLTLASGSLAADVTSVAGRTGAVTLSISDISGLGTGVAAWLATPSSANLASAVTDETGSGSLVLATSPTFTTSTTIAGGTVTASTPLITATQTWNASGVTFYGADWNFTRTASASGSLLARWRDGATELVSVHKDGYLQVNPQTSPFPMLQIAGGSRVIGTGSGSTIYIGSAGAVFNTSSGNISTPGRIAFQSAFSSTEANITQSMQSGTATPEASITANPGSLYLRNNSGTGELWIKASGTGNTGWAKIY